MTPLRRNAIANIAGRIVTAILWIAVTPFVLSRLGPERFGIWSLFFAFNSYLLSLDLGIGSTLVRFIAAQRPSGDRRSLLRTLRWGIWVAVGLGLAWSVLIAVTRGWIADAFHVPAQVRPEALDALLVFGIGAMLTFPVQVLIAALQGFERLDLSNFCIVLGVLAQAVVLVVGVSMGGGVTAAAMAGVIGQAVSGLLAGFLLWTQLRDFDHGGQGAGPSLRDLMNFGGALQLLGMLYVLQFQSGRIVLGVLGNLSMVADYELSFRVAYAVYSIPILIQGAVIPTVSRVQQSEGHKAVESLFTSSSRWIYTQSVIALGMLWLLAPDIARVWLGPGHERIADLIRLSAIAYIACLSYSPAIAVARGMGRPWFEVWSHCATVLTHIGLAIWWIPRYGTAGAIAAIGVSFVIGFLAFVPVFHWRCGIPFRPWFGREFLPRLVAGLLAVVFVAALFETSPLAARLPAYGWAHGAVIALAFLTTFALFFVPLGDTQRLSQALWHVTTGALDRGRGLKVS